MGRKSKATVGHSGSIPRANAVPRLKLDELKTAGRPTPRQDILGGSQSDRFSLYGTPSSSRSQKLSPSRLPRPNSRTYLNSGRGFTPRTYPLTGLGSVRSSQMSSARDGTPRTFSGRTNDSVGSARRQGSAGDIHGQGKTKCLSSHALNHPLGPSSTLLITL